jgi:hypothetical protein
MQAQGSAMRRMRRKGLDTAQASSLSWAESNIRIQAYHFTPGPGISVCASDAAALLGRREIYARVLRERLKTTDANVETSMVDLRALSTSFIDEAFTPSRPSLKATRSVLCSVMERLGPRTPLATDGEYLPLSTLRSVVERRLFVPTASLTTMPAASPLHAPSTSRHPRTCLSGTAARSQYRGGPVSRQPAFYSQASASGTRSQGPPARFELLAALKTLPMTVPPAGTGLDLTSPCRILDLRRALVCSVPQAAQIAKSLASARRFTVTTALNSMETASVPASWSFAISELILAVIHVLAVFTPQDTGRMKAFPSVESLLHRVVHVTTVYSSCVPGQTTSRTVSLNVILLSLSCLSHRWSGTDSTAVLSFDGHVDDGASSVHIEPLEDEFSRVESSTPAIPACQIRGAQPFAAATIPPRRRATSFCQIVLFILAMEESGADDTDDTASIPDMQPLQAAITAVQETASNLARLATQEGRLDDALRKSDAARAAVGSYVPPWLLSLAVADAQNAVRGARLRVEGGGVVSIGEAHLLCSCHSFVFFMTYAIRMTSAIRLRFGTGVSVSVVPASRSRLQCNESLTLRTAFRSLSRVVITVPNAKRKVGRISVALGADNPAVASTVAVIDYPFASTNAHAHLSSMHLAPPCLAQNWNVLVGGDEPSSCSTTGMESNSSDNERKKMLCDFAFIMLYVSPISLSLLSSDSRTALTVDAAKAHALPLIPSCDDRYMSSKQDRSGNASSLRTRRAITPLMQHTTGGCRWTVQMCRGLLVRQVRDLHEPHDTSRERSQMVSLSFGMGHSVAAVEASYRIGSPTETALRALSRDDIDSFASQAIGTPGLGDVIDRHNTDRCPGGTTTGGLAEDADTRRAIWSLFMGNPVTALALGAPYLVDVDLSNAGPVYAVPSRADEDGRVSFWPDRLLKSGGFAAGWLQCLGRARMSLARTTQRSWSHQLSAQQMQQQRYTVPLSLELWSHNTLVDSAMGLRRVSNSSGSGRAFADAAVELRAIARSFDPHERARKGPHAGKPGKSWNRIAMYRCVLGLAGAESMNMRSGDGDKDVEEESSSSSESSGMDDSDESVYNEEDIGLEGDTCSSHSNDSLDNHSVIDVDDGDEDDRDWVPDRSPDEGGYSESEVEEEGGFDEGADPGGDIQEDDYAHGVGAHGAECKMIDGGRVSSVPGLRKFMAASHFAATMAAFGSKSTSTPVGGNGGQLSETMHRSKRARVCAPPPSSVAVGTTMEELAMAWCLNDSGLGEFMGKSRLEVVPCTRDMLPRVVRLESRRNVSTGDRLLHVWTSGVRILASMRVRLEDLARDTSKLQEVLQVLELSLATQDEGPTDDSFSPSALLRIASFILGAIAFIVSGSVSRTGVRRLGQQGQCRRMVQALQKRLILSRTRRGDCIARNVHSQAMDGAGTLKAGAEALVSALGDCISRCIQQVTQVSSCMDGEHFGNLVSDVSRGRRMCAAILYLLLGAPARPAHVVYAAAFFGRHVGIEHFTATDRNGNHPATPGQRGQDDLSSIHLVFQPPIDVASPSVRSRLLRHPLPALAQLALGFLLLTCPLHGDSDSHDCDVGVNVLYPCFAALAEAGGANSGEGRRKAAMKAIEDDILSGLCDGGVFGDYRPTCLRDVREWVFTEGIREAPHYRNILMNLQGRSYAEEQNKRRGSDAFT